MISAPSANCQICILQTTRRCSQCGVCVLCSEGCEARYRVQHHGNAACQVHRTSGLFRTDPWFAESCRTLNDAPTSCHVVMAPIMQNTLQAVLHGAVNYVLGIVGQSKAPLHEKTVLGLSIAPKGCFGTHASVGCLRQVGVDVAQSDPHLGAQLVLFFLGRLAVAQHLIGFSASAEDSTFDSTNPPMRLHVLMLAMPVKVSGSKHHVLQFSMLPFNGDPAGCCDVSKLTCTRTDELRARYNVFFNQKLKTVIHEESGLPVFTCSRRIDPASGPNLSMAPHVPWERVAQALSIEPTTPTTPRDPPASATRTTTTTAP